MKKLELPKKLNICLIANQFPVLGQTVDFGFLWPIAKGLAKNHNVTVISWKNPQNKEVTEEHNVKAYFLGHGKKKGVFVDLTHEKFIQLHKKKPFHIVHSIDDNGRLIGMNKKKYQVAMTYDVRATKMSRMFSIIGMHKNTVRGQINMSFSLAVIFFKTYFGKDRGLLQTADGIFVTTSQQKVALERHYLYPEEKTYLVPYGVEIRDLSKKEESSELKSKIKLNLHSPIVMTISDMTEVSEIRNILISFEKLAIKKPLSRLIIIGDGPQKKEIEYEMLMRALGSKVIFLGDVPENALSDYISIADIFINLQARTTGFEASLLEAMAQQKIIIGSAVSPISSIVNDGQNGFLIRPSDTESLARLLIKIFAEELPTKKIGQNARERMLNIFNTQGMVKKTLLAYYKTLESTSLYRKPISPLSKF